MATKIVWCTNCKKYDAQFQLAGGKLRDLRCLSCGGVVVSPQKRMAKVHAYAPLMQRCANAVALAAAGVKPVDEAVEHARYAAHIAITQRLVTYGPEASR